MSADLLSFEDCLSVLTSNEGDSVTLNCQDPEAFDGDSFAVDVNGGWTDWQDARYMGDTQLAALKKAALQKLLMENIEVSSE